MRKYIDIVEGRHLATLPATPENILRAKAFVEAKWRERAAERSEKVPDDLCSACKFCAAFAQRLFGGIIEANDFHTWLNLDGRVIDLCEDASDAKEMLTGNIPADQRNYAKMFNLTFRGIYMPDEEFMALPDFRDSMESIRPRIDRWASEFRQQLHESVEPVFYHVTPARNLPAIMRDGLIPTVGARSRQLDEDDAIFLFPTREAAENAVMNWLGDEFDEEEALALLEVRLPPETVLHREAFEVQLRERIPPERIRVVTNDF